MERGSASPVLSCALGGDGSPGPAHPWQLWAVGTPLSLCRSVPAEPPGNVPQWVLGHHMAKESLPQDLRVPLLAAPRRLGRIGPVPGCEQRPVLPRCFLGSLAGRDSPRDPAGLLLGAVRSLSMSPSTSCSLSQCWLCWQRCCPRAAAAPGMPGRAGCGAAQQLPALPALCPQPPAESGRHCLLHPPTPWAALLCAAGLAPLRHGAEERPRARPSSQHPAAPSPLHEALPATGASLSLCS